MCCDLRVGVASQAACWIPLVRVATASSMLILDFVGIFMLIRSSRIARKASQSVDLLCSDGFCCSPKCSVLNFNTNDGKSP